MADVGEPTPEQQGSDPGGDDWERFAEDCRPDALDLVREVDVMMAVYAAQRAVRVNAMRREALVDAAHDGRRQTDVVERAVRLEIAMALRVTEYAAGALITRAEALVNRYRPALDALSEGRITERHSDLLVDALDDVEPQYRSTILPRALAIAEAEPVGRFRRLLSKLIEAVRYESLAQRHEAALVQRRLVVEPAPDGMAWLVLLAPAVEVQAAHGRVTRMAKVLAAAEGESRTLDQLRADIVGDLLVDGVTGDHPREASGVRATVSVTVPVLSLLEGCVRIGGAADGDGAAAAEAGAGSGAGAGAGSGAGAGAGAGSGADAGARSGAGAGDPSGGGVTPVPTWHELPIVEGVGPIPLDRARELCGGAEGWMRVLTHPETGAVLSVGRELYRPPPSLRRLVRWRADRCLAPGCSIPASRCEIDHTVAWEHGGTTSIDNLAPLCRGHHMVKHHGGWSVRQVGGAGELEWTSPAGRVYRVQPERAMPVFRPSVEPAPF